MVIIKNCKVVDVMQCANSEMGDSNLIILESGHKEGDSS